MILDFNPPFTAIVPSLDVEYLDVIVLFDRIRVNLVPSPENESENGVSDTLLLLCHIIAWTFKLYSSVEK